MNSTTPQTLPSSSPGFFSTVGNWLNGLMYGTPKAASPTPAAPTQSLYPQQQPLISNPATTTQQNPFASSSNPIVTTGAQSYGPTAPPVASVQNSNANSFSSMFGSLTPQQQQAYISANPNVDTTTGNARQLPTPTSIASNQFTIGPGPTISSSSTNPSVTVADATSAAQKAREALFNGTADSSKVPSNDLYAAALNQRYNSALYSPEQLDNMQKSADLQSSIINTQLATRLTTRDLSENGAMTKAEAAGFLSEAQRRATDQLAGLAAGQAGIDLRSQVLALQQQNKVGALDSYLKAMAPVQVAPGSSLINPVTGQSTYGSGISPIIASQADTFIKQDEATGNLELNQDGTINQAYYKNKALSYYNNGLIPGATQQNGGSGGTQQQSQPGTLPPNIANQPYVIPASANAPSYINLGRVPQGQQQYVATAAGNAGIPVLSADDASNVQGIQYTQQALQPLETVMNQVLAPGVAGRGLNIAKNLLNDIFQNQPELVAFNQARSTAIKVIQSLAAGSGSGFRLTQPEIDTATNNMPVATDNLETAQTKLAYVKSYLANELNLKITGNANNYIPPNLNGQSSGGSNVIQTKVGAVDNSWFQ